MSDSNKARKASSKVAPAALYAPTAPSLGAQRDVLAANTKTNEHAAREKALLSAVDKLLKDDPNGDGTLNAAELKQLLRNKVRFQPLHTHPLCVAALKCS